MAVWGRGEYPPTSQAAQKAGMATGYCLVGDVLACANALGFEGPLVEGQGCA